MTLRRWLSRRRKAEPCCPVCGNKNFVESPFEGRTDQGVIGYDRTFQCGFATHWRGYRKALCSAAHPHPVAQAIDDVSLAARRHLNGASSTVSRLAS